MPINSIQFAFHFLPVLYKSSSSENTRKIINKPTDQAINLKLFVTICMQLTVLQTNLLQAESANVNLCVNWSKLVDLLNICLWNSIPNLCEVVWEILVFSLAWLLAFTKLFGWLVCRVVGLFTCKQTSARRVVKFYCHSWSPISEDLHVKAHVKPHVKCMWK